jgi:predicted RNA-binding Zn-ribbon protein involved in translation (DUF1610 family)
MLKVVKKSGTNFCRFTCPECNKTLEGVTDDLTFVKHQRWSAILKFKCPHCGKTGQIKDRKVEIVETYVECTDQK